MVDVMSSLNPAGSCYASNHIIRANQYLEANYVPGTCSCVPHGGVDRRHCTPVRTVDDEHMTNHVFQLNQLQSPQDMNEHFVNLLGLPVSNIGQSANVQTANFNLRKTLDW